MRSAKMSKALGGGSLTALLLTPGSPATGVSKRVSFSVCFPCSETSSDRGREFKALYLSPIRPGWHVGDCGRDFRPIDA